MKRVLVTGATGRLGPHVLRSLLSEGTTRVTCVMRSSSVAEAEQRIRASLGDPEVVDLTRRVSVVLGDVGRPDLGLTSTQLDALRTHHDACIHAAAWTSPGSDPAQSHSVNVEGTQRIVDLCAAGGLALHYVSSIGVFRWTQGSIDTATAAERPSDADATLPYHDYHQTKWKAEQRVLHSSVRAMVSRLGNLSPQPAAPDVLVRAARETGLLPDAGAGAFWFANTISGPLAGAFLARLVTSGCLERGVLSLIERPTFHVSEVRPFLSERGLVPAAVTPEAWLAAIDETCLRSALPQIRATLQVAPARHFRTETFRAALPRLGLRGQTLSEALSETSDKPAVWH